MLGLLRNDLYQLSSNETYTLPEGDDGAGLFVFQPPFFFNGSLLHDIFVCLCMLHSYYNFGANSSTMAMLLNTKLRLLPYRYLRWPVANGQAMACRDYVFHLAT